MIDARDINEFKSVTAALFPPFASARPLRDIAIMLQPVSGCDTSQPEASSTRRECPSKGPQPAPAVSAVRGE